MESGANKGNDAIGRKHGVSYFDQSSFDSPKEFYQDWREMATKLDSAQIEPAALTGSLALGREDSNIISEEKIRTS